MVLGLHKIDLMPTFWSVLMLKECTTISFLLHPHWICFSTKKRFYEIHLYLCCFYFICQMPVFQHNPKNVTFFYIANIIYHMHKSGLALQDNWSPADPAPHKLKPSNIWLLIQGASDHCVTELECTHHYPVSIRRLRQWISYAACLWVQTQHAWKCKKHLIFILWITTFLSHCFPWDWQDLELSARCMWIPAPCKSSEVACDRAELFCLNAPWPQTVWRIFAH